MDNSASIVIPTYKSGGFIEVSLAEINEHAQQLFTQYEIILVDDGSNDENITLAAKQLHKKGMPLRLIRLRQNYGQFWATNVGLMLTKYSRIVTIDDDLKFSPTNLKTLVGMANGHTDFLVYGVLKGGPVKHGGRQVLNFFAGKRTISSLRYFSKTLIEGIENLNLQLDAHFEILRHKKKYHHAEFYITPPTNNFRKLSRTTFISKIIIVFNYSPFYPKNKSLHFLVFFTLLSAVLLYFNLLIPFAFSALCALFFIAMRIKYMLAPAAIKTKDILWDEVDLSA